MISKIISLKDYGVFKDFNSKSVNEFKTYNLIYGWNGSGKTTLSRLFTSLEKKVKSPAFTGGKFQVQPNKGQLIDQGNISECTLNIKVFNKDFVDANIDWEKQGAKGILLISEENIEEKKNLKEIKKKIDTKNASLEETQKEITAINARQAGFLTDTARGIKNSFKAIETNENYYFNYDRSKIRSFITTHLEMVKSGACILSEEAEDAIRKSIKPENKPKITLTNISIDSSELTNAKERIKNLLSSKIYAKSINRFITAPDVAHWVEAGIKLHKTHSSNTCEFCGNEITTAHMAELEAHFNKDYEETKIRIKSAISWLSDRKIDKNCIPETHNFYDELHVELKNAEKDLKLDIENFNVCLDTWIEQLNRKYENVFDSITLEETAITKSLVDIDLAFSKIQSLVERHNQKTENFELKLRESKEKLELHYISQAIKENGYFEQEQKILELSERHDSEFIEVTDLEKEKSAKEAKLSNEALGASYFNALLHKFIGRNDISIEFDDLNKGYKLIRSGLKKPATNLSEGEKTAIGFIYFITKLHEQGNEIRNTIVVIDDPVSSLDSNYLLHAFSFLRNETENAQQLFVLTHNFLFFKMVRDWILPKNNPKKEIHSSECYSIKNFIIEGERHSEIENANQSLITYHSEYHYLFYKVLTFKRLETVDLDESYSIANLSRRLLEAFLSFKFPIHRDFRQKIFNTNDFDEVRKDRIYTFIQKYSHSDRIESVENLADHLISEGKVIIEDILELIKHIDSTHYNEMLRLCSAKS